MGFFSDLKDKIFGHATPTAESSSSAPVATPGAASTSAAATPAPPPLPVVDVTAILDGLAAKNKEKLDWRRSIVDLMKLVDVDSGLSARKKLAAELKYPGDTGDSAKLNVWLHKEVIKKLAANGGKVPADLLN